MNKINVVEIARICGVTPSTVSRALNNRSDISGKTREKILLFCREHGFSRNMTARSLRMKSTDTVIFIMPDYTYAGAGVHVDGVTAGRPAERAGIQKGDVLIQLGEHSINSVEGYMQALGKFKKGDKAKVKFKRGETVMESEVQF